MRGYSLILLGICAFAVAGWIALSDGLIDRTETGRNRFFQRLCRRPTDLAGPPRRRLSAGAAARRRKGRVRRPRGAVLRLALSAVLPCGRGLVAAFPYAFGLAIWLAASFAAYLATLRAILPRPETC